MATAGVAGRFVEPVCEPGHPTEPHDGARFTGPLAALAVADPSALLVDTGGLLAPHGVCRFAAREQPASLAELVQSLGYRALAFGENDLGAPRPRTLEVARVLAARGVPYVATNLRCEASARALCDVVVDAGEPRPVLLRAGSEQVAVLALLDPEVLSRVAPDRAEGLHVDPIERALPDATRAARALGATLVIAVLDVTTPGAFAVARNLPPDGRPDLVLVADVGDDLLFARPPTVAPAIASPQPGQAVELRVTPSTVRDGFEVVALPLEPSDTPAPGVQAFAETVGPAYCSALGDALPGGRLARPMDAADVATLAAQLVRERAGADVAFLNVDAVDRSFRTGEAQLTESDLYVALEYDEPLVVADVPPAWLSDVTTRLGARTDVVHPGLDAGGPGGAARVRGRAVVPNAGYRVVTIRFLAAGGDGALPALPAGATWRTLETTSAEGQTRYVSLRDVVLDALGEPDVRDPRDHRPSPNEPPEWVLRAAVDGNFAGSSIRNPAGYDAALLGTGDALAMGLELALRADATAPSFTWENTLIGRYRTQWSPSAMPGEPGTFVEGTDQLQLRTLGAYRGLRAGTSAWWIPDPYVEAFVESELSRPEARDWHWLLVRPTLGARFALTAELDLKLQLGLQSQLLSPTASAQPGAGASLLLRPWSVLSGSGRAFTLEGALDFFAFDLGGQNRWQLRGQLGASLDLAGPLALTFGVTTYLQQDGGMPLGVAFAVTSGLRLGALTRVIGP